MQAKTPGWSEWKLFPDPRYQERLNAPFGPGCYELRIGSQLLLYGSGAHCAARMTSLLPKPLGCGTRDNARKREDVLRYLGRVEYRTLACATPAEAKAEERKLQARKSEYLHPA
jgi:hypothetical protein